MAYYNNDSHQARRESSTEPTRRAYYISQKRYAIARMVVFGLTMDKESILSYCNVPAAAYNACSLLCAYNVGMARHSSSV